MRGQQAVKACPDLQLVQVPTKHGKADLEIYRTAGSAVVAVLGRGGTCERASVDECYVDVTAAATQRLREAQAGAGAAALLALAAAHVAGVTDDTANTVSKDDVRKGHAAHGAAAISDASARWWA